MATSECAGLSNIDYIFLFGNLNFRLTLPAQACDAIIGEYKALKSKGGNLKALDAKIQELLTSDQLLNSKMNNSILSEFEEPDISFMPTYKFEARTGAYIIDNESSPSWYFFCIIKKGLTEF